MAILTRTRKGDGVTVYLIDFRDQNGVQRREVAGTTRTQAKNLLTRRLGEVRAGTYVNEREAKKKEKRERGPTFREFAATFLEEYAVHKRSRFYQVKVPHLVDYFGDAPLKDVTRAQINLYAAKRLKTVSGNTVRKELAVVSRMFVVAVEWGILAASPAVRLSKPKEPEHKTRFLSREEFDRLEAAAPPWLKPIIVVAVCTGLRLKELCNLTWADVDLQRRTLFVSEDNKAGKPRTVPLNDHAARTLKKLVRHISKSHVFHDPEGNAMLSEATRNKVSKATAAAYHAAEITDATFHTLRHTCASWLVARGVPIYDVQRFLGHSTPLMTQRYAHLAPEHLRRAADALSAVLSEANRSDGRK